jgi:hypothetical protein
MKSPLKMATNYHELTRIRVTWRKFAAKFYSWWGTAHEVSFGKLNGRATVQKSYSGCRPQKSDFYQATLERGKLR